MDGSMVMALQLSNFHMVSVANETIWAVPGDVLVDYLSGERKLLHKIEFDEFIERNGLTLSGDRGFGWVLCTKPGG